MSNKPSFLKILEKAHKEVAKTGKLSWKTVKKAKKQNR